MAASATRSFHRRLHAWYKHHGRTFLPWRNTTDAYAIYVSEIMLQQTQVKTVLERYYTPFLTRFPTLAALANAKETDVLKAWQGLGYYHRALNLHKTAQQQRTALPRSIEALMALPGIGRNTAHAIAAFAHHMPVAVMEANVKRVLCRIFAMRIPSEKELWEKAATLLDPKNPFDYNQAMMDLGSMLCTKRKPDCPRCPANAICIGKASPESYPAPKTKKAVPVRKQTICVQQNQRGQYYATARTGNFLKGMYHFPEGPPPPNSRRIGHVRQQYSHFTLEADVYMMKSTKSGKNWHSMAELRALPHSGAEEKIIGLINQENGRKKN